MTLPTQAYNPFHDTTEGFVRFRPPSAIHKVGIEGIENTSSVHVDAVINLATGSKKGSRERLKFVLTVESLS